MDANLIKTGDDGFDTVVEFVDGFIVDIAVDASDARTFSLAEGFEEVFGLLDGGFEVGRSIIWDDDEERFVHNIGFLGKNIDKIDVIVHQNAKEHVVVVATHLDEALNIWSNVDALGAD